MDPLEASLRTRLVVSRRSILLESPKNRFSAPVDRRVSARLKLSVRVAISGSSRTVSSDVRFCVELGLAGLPTSIFSRKLYTHGVALPGGAGGGGIGGNTAS